MLAKCSCWMAVGHNGLAKTWAGLAPQEIFWFILQTFPILKNVLFTSGDWLCKSLSEVEIKYLFQPNYKVFKSLTNVACPTQSVVNLTCINLSRPNTHLSAGTHLQNRAMVKLSRPLSLKRKNTKRVSCVYKGLWPLNESPKPTHTATANSHLTVHQNILHQMECWSNPGEFCVCMVKAT